VRWHAGGRCRCFDDDEMVCGYYEGYCQCRCHEDDDELYDADELGLDPEEDSWR
jgi:hypothetical protein